jgi:hypothetical protein
MLKKYDEFKINERLTRTELVKDLKDAKYISVEFNKDWCVTYLKGGERKYEGDFNTNAEAHQFLIDNGIDYIGKEGYLDMKRRRDQFSMDYKIPFKKYQDELLIKGIDKDLL